MRRKLILLATITGALGVIMGAFGAHTLKSKVSPEHLEAIRTGVLYLFIHVLATLWTTTAGQSSAYTGWIRKAGIAFMVGILLFSGSLFLIGTSSMTGLDTANVGFITPMGGLCFILGWICAAFWVVKESPTHEI